MKCFSSDGQGVTSRVDPQFWIHYFDLTMFIVLAVQDVSATPIDQDTLKILLQLYKVRPQLALT